MRVPRSARRPPDGAAGDVVLVMGLPGAGKSTLAEELVGQGYARLNRDEAGGSLGDLVPVLSKELAAGRRRVVLDNTYGSRAARNEVIEAAWEQGAPARCVWLQTSLEEAQVNVVQRMIARHGRLLEPEEIKRAARDDPGALAPGALFRHRREMEAPEVSEGFTRVAEVPFHRRAAPGRDNRALIFWYDGVVRRSRSGARTPTSPEDVELLPGAAEVLQRHHADGWRVLGVSWQPEIEKGNATPAVVEAALRRTNERLGVEVDAVYCPHGDGPPACWCRKPLPGLAVLLIERHRLDPARCLYVGRDASDEAFARVAGFTYRPAGDVFGVTG